MQSRNAGRIADTFGQDRSVLPILYRMIAFEKVPTRKDVTQTLAQLFERYGSNPMELLLDCGTQFDCFGFKEWSRRYDIKLRYGKLHRHSLIAVTYRFYRSLKSECTELLLVPTNKAEYEEEINFSGNGITDCVRI